MVCPIPQGGHNQRSRLHRLHRPTVEQANVPCYCLNSKCSAIAEMGDRLATIDIWAESWGCGHFFFFFLGGEVGSPSNTMLPWLRPTFVPSGILIHPTVWRQQTWPKIGGCAPFYYFLGVGSHLVPPFSGDRSASNTMWPGPRPTSVPTTKWHLDPSTDMGQKLGCVPLAKGSWIHI